MEPDGQDHRDREPESSEASEDGLKVSADDNVGRIREILFGGQMEDYDRRFARLEAQMQQNTADLREELRQRCEGLEHLIRSEVAGVRDQLGAEQETREEGVGKLSQEIHNLSAVFETKLNQLAAHTAASQRDLNDALLEQIKRLTDEMRETQTALSDTMDTRLSEMGRSKADRTALASLLGDVVSRLQQE